MPHQYRLLQKTRHGLYQPMIGAVSDFVAIADGAAAATASSLTANSRAIRRMMRLLFSERLKLTRVCLRPAAARAGPWTFAPAVCGQASCGRGSPCGG